MTFGQAEEGLWYRCTLGEPYREIEQAGERNQGTGCWDFTVELVWMRRGAQAGWVLGLVRFLHLFSGFSAVLQASIQNALQCVADCSC